MQHLSGSANLPSDFACRNAPSCNEPRCQVCSFVAQTEDSVVHHVTAQDVLSGSSSVPFTNRQAWIHTQMECSGLRRVHSHLKQGTRPSKKATNIKDVKRYLQHVTIARDGLLVVKQEQAFSPTRERIVIPRQVLEGLITALHLRLMHPSCHQLKLVMHRYFFALNMDTSIEQVSRTCHQCMSLAKFPSTEVEQSTSEPQEVGSLFAADVLKRERQLILVVREYVTSYTAACLIDSEKHTSLRSGLIQLCIDLRPLDGPISTVRTDPAPGFVTLKDDDTLRASRLCLEIGNAKNVNKNPVADKAIQELEEELLRQEPSGGPVSSLTLSLAVAQLNTRIRSRGLSAREMWSQRDQFTNSQLPVVDRELVMSQHLSHHDNHPHSINSKAPQGRKRPHTTITVGDLIYLYSDRNKSQARSRYLVVSTDGEWCHIRKFSGSQFRSLSYKVRKSDCYKVPDAYAVASNKACAPREEDSDISDFEDSDPQHQGVTSPSPTASPSPYQPIHHPVQGSSPEHETHEAYSASQDNVATDSALVEDASRSSDSESEAPHRRSSCTGHPPSYLSDYLLQ